MGRYKLSEDAKEDLRRIYRYGVLTFGESQADRYYDALFERFAQIAYEPYLFHQSTQFVLATAAAFVALIIFFIE